MIENSLISSNSPHEYTESTESENSLTMPMKSAHITIHMHAHYTSNGHIIQDDPCMAVFVKKRLKTLASFSVAPCAVDLGYVGIRSYV